MKALPSHPCGTRSPLSIAAAPCVARPRRMRWGGATPGSPRRRRSGARRRSRARRARLGALRAGDLAGARAVFEAALGEDPDRLAALNDLAVSYLIEGHADAARRLLDEVVASGTPREQQAALVNLGELYAAEGYVSAAQAYLETARAIDPARAEPLLRARAPRRRPRRPRRGRGRAREALRLDERGAARAAFAYVYPEERVHLEALVAEAAGDRALARGALAGALREPLRGARGGAERHLAGE